MSNIRMLRNILKNIVRKPGDKDTFRHLYNNAKNDLYKMDNLRTTFDPSYPRYDDSFVRDFDERGFTNFSPIDSYSKEHLYNDNHDRFSSLLSQLDEVEKVVQDYPLFQLNRDNINYDAIYEDLDNFIRSYDYTDRPLDIKPEAHRFVYKQMYNDDPDRLLDEMADTYNKIMTKEVDEPEREFFDNHLKAMRLFDIR